MTPSIFNFAPTIDELKAGPAPAIPVPLEEALAARDAAQTQLNTILAGNGTSDHPQEQWEVRRAQEVLELSVIAAWEEMVRDKRHELDLPCPTWDDGHCACPKHGAQVACPSWNNGCNCITGHDTEEACPKWAKGCCCDHDTSERRVCNNHTLGHTGAAHASAVGRAWCALHQGTDCVEPCQHVSLDQFMMRFK